MQTPGIRLSLVRAALAMTCFLSMQSAVAVPIVTSGFAADQAGLQSVVDAFRAALGAPNNGNAPGPLADGRREINWDGGGANTTPSGTPFNFFQNIRGALFTTPGTGFLQAPDEGLATALSNPTYEEVFEAFSAQRLFTPVDSNVTDVSFFIPGTSGAAPATVSAFGAIFNDVDFSDTTQLLFFGSSGSSLGSFSAPVGNFSFLGVSFTDEAIARVRIVTGNSQLGPNDGGDIDVVAMDDFLYAEPQLLQVPEPPSLALLALLPLGAWALGRIRRRRIVVR